MKILKKFISIGTLSIALTSVVVAQEVKPARLTGGVQSVTTDGDFVISRTLILRPKIAQQALSSRLFPSADKLRRGSAAPIYLRMAYEASLDLQKLDNLFRSNTGETSLEDLDVDFVLANAPLRWGELKRAAFRQQANWEYPLEEQAWVDIGLPDVQQSRVFHYGMVQCARVDIKRGLIPQAEEKICIAFAYNKHIGETPIIVARIVQSAQCRQALHAVEELIQHPLAPNYFWDITSIPRPFIDVREAIQCESTIVEKTFPELLNLERMTTERDWNELHDRVIAKLPMFEGNAKIYQSEGPEKAAAISDWTKLAKERLPTKFPKYADKVNAMCDSEVSVRYWWERVTQLNREHLAVALLEPHEAVPRSIAEDKRLALACADELPVATTLLALSNQFIHTAWELEQKFAMLRVVEAIRDWSGRNDGKLPASLDDLTLPIPADCLTNKPFRYELAADGKTADLRSGKVPYAHGTNEPTHVRYLHYHLTLE
jgi:hypothetical protein